MGRSSNWNNNILKNGGSQGTFAVDRLHRLHRGRQLCRRARGAGGDLGGVAESLPAKRPLFSALASESGFLVLVGACRGIATIGLGRYAPFY